VIAADTNVVVRLLVADDRRQTERASALFRAESIYLGKTVLLETEWVLRGAYGLSSAAIAPGLRKVLGLSGVTVEDSATVARALDWYEEGLDFADALHLASSGAAPHFATFDRKLLKRAKGLVGAPTVVAP
jgi:predicted nucleic-acid-binding protein